MKSRTKLVSTIAGLLALAALAACSSGDNPSSSLLARTGLTAEEGPIALTATPPEVVIDLNDPNTPIDPGTQEAYGETALTAVVLDDLGAPAPGVEVVFTATGGTLASGGQPVMTGADGKAGDVLRLLVSDPDSVDVTATAGEDSRTITVTKTVIPLNSPPTADAGPDQEAECGETTVLDGSASSDADSTPGTNDSIERFVWLLDAQPLGEGETFSVVLPLGTHVVTLEVTDKVGAKDTDELTVTVIDTLPPEVTVTLGSFWPPNHKMVDVHATVTVVDACPVPPNPPPTVMLLSVTSDEPENDLGDGDTEPDITGVEPGTEDYDFQVRAERSGTGSGRVYTAVYQVTDFAGNVVEAEGHATVPHNQ